MHFRSGGGSLPIDEFRPLLSHAKDDIVDEARRLGTFEEATIDPACRRIAPEDPPIAMVPERLEELERETGVESLIDRAYEAAERVPLRTARG